MLAYWQMTLPGSLGVWFVTQTLFWEYELFTGAQSIVALCFRNRKKKKSIFPTLPWHKWMAFSWHSGWALAQREVFSTVRCLVWESWGLVRHRSEWCRACSQQSCCCLEQQREHSAVLKLELTVIKLGSQKRHPQIVIVEELTQATRLALLSALW